MSDPWNLTPVEWSKVLDTSADEKQVAKRLQKGECLPWNEVLQNYAADSKTTLDLGSGRGENSAMLALRGCQTTLFDWSQENLDFSRRLFTVMRRTGTFLQGDITKPLPFADNSFDMVFSCGVLEYFTDDQIKNILKEIFRVSRKRVIILVPNAYSICYRLGMWYMKKKKTWHWGGERAFKTLKHCFKIIPNIQVSEFSVGTKHSLVFLDSFPQGPLIHRALRKIFNLRDHSRPSGFNQGYILITVGNKS